ncbi:hypothetical protein ACEPAI_5547 [Sanghuangporus weigelae]
MRPQYLWLVLASVLAPISSRMINVTIDDAFGDPTNGRQIQYFPSTAWQRGDGCQPCTAKPSPASDAWLGTWHDATFNPNDTATNSALGQIIVASAQFTGTAVYVNCILTRSFTSPDGNTDMTFYFDDDDNPADVFQKTPNGDTSYQFGVTVFSATNLPFGEHTVRLEVGHAGQKALVLLDSITYTADDGSGGPVSSSSTATGAESSSFTPAPSQTSLGSNLDAGLFVGPIVPTSILIIALIIVVGL